MLQVAAELQINWHRPTERPIHLPRMTPPSEFDVGRWALDVRRFESQ